MLADRRAEAGFEILVRDTTAPNLVLAGIVGSGKSCLAKSLYTRSIPFGRLGAPEEVANVVLFLASPMASWVTGQTIQAGGGIVM